MLFILPASTFSGLSQFGWDNNPNTASITDLRVNEGCHFSFKMSAHTSPVKNHILGWKIGSRNFIVGPHTGKSGETLRLILQIKSVNKLSFGPFMNPLNSFSLSYSNEKCSFSFFSNNSLSLLSLIYLSESIL